MKRLLTLLIIAFTLIIFTACDETAPTISGVDEKVSIQCGTEFNLNDYLNENLKISDDKDTGEISYEIDCDESIYERETGKIDTLKDGEFPVNIIATDKAGNASEYKFTLSLEPIHISTENMTPIVYDGEYAKVQLLNAAHGYIDGTNQYEFEFEVENRTDELMDVYFGSSATTINKYQVGAYYTNSPIGAGNIGKSEIRIFDEDIPEDIGTITEIKTVLRIAKSEPIDSGKEPTVYVNVPLVIDTNIF